MKTLLRSLMVVLGLSILFGQEASAASNFTVTASPYPAKNYNGKQAIAGFRLNLPVMSLGDTATAIVNVSEFIRPLLGASGALTTSFNLTSNMGKLSAGDSVQVGISVSPGYVDQWAAGQWLTFKTQTDTTTTLKKIKIHVPFAANATTSLLPFPYWRVRVICRHASGFTAVGRWVGVNFWTATTINP